MGPTPQIARFFSLLDHFVDALLVFRPRPRISPASRAIEIGAGYKLYRLIKVESPSFMRLLVISDIHLEFGLFEFPADMPEFDTAVFAGNIHQPVTAAVEWLAHERDAGALKGRPIVYVLGNHEFYEHEMKAEPAKGEAAADEAGIHLLNRRAVVAPLRLRLPGHFRSRSSGQISSPMRGVRLSQ